MCFILSALPAMAANAAKPADTKKVVIPFDFVSKFDDGRYGTMMGDMIWKKLDREGGFVIPESMLDVRAYCESHKLQPSPDIDLVRMKKVVCDDFGAQIGIWGSIERAPGAEKDIYDVAIKCVDLSTDPPEIIYDVKGQTRSVSEVPHTYVKKMFDALYRRSSPAAGGSPLVAEENWKKNPNLIAGGDFESGDGGVPKGWEKVAGQQREPLGRLVRWIPEVGNPGNKVVRFTLDKDVAENEGLMYYSQPFPVVEGAKYRFQCRWRSNGPTVKVFIKCYDDVATTYSESQEQDKAGANSSGGPGQSALLPSEHRREIYRSQQNLTGPANTWNTQTEDFTPKHTKYAPKWGRVMLYAYFPAGVVEFDDVVVKQISPAPSPGEPTKVPRHSSETKISVEEMKANEGRSQQIKRDQARPREAIGPPSEDATRPNLPGTKP